MAYGFDTGLDFDAQEQEMLQAAARIKALRGLKYSDPDQVEGFTSAVTGAKILAPTVKKPLLSTLSPLIADESAALQERNLNQQRSEVTRAQQDALAKLWNEAPKATTEEVRTPLAPYEPTGSFKGTPEEIIGAINSIGDPTERARALQGYKNQVEAPGGYRTKTVTTPPTREAQMDFLGKMSRSGPLARTMASKYGEYLLTKEPELEEARAARLHERQLTIEQARQKQADELAYRRANDEANRLNRTQNAEIMAGVRRDTAPLPRTPTLTPAGTNEKGQPIFIRNGNEADIVTSPGQKTEDKPPKPLPAAQSKAWIDNNVNISRVDEALKMLGTPAGKEAMGKKGYLGNIPGVGQDILNATDPGGVTMRAIISDISTMEVHDRSGATVTAAEYPRLKPFIPLVTDTPEEAAKKLRNFKTKYAEIQQEIINFAQDMGYKMPTVRPSGGASGSWEPVAVPQVGEVRDGYRFRGGDPNSKSSWEPAK